MQVAHYIKTVYIYFILQTREFGRRLNIIIIAEGAIDRHCNPITCDYVKDVSSFVVKHIGRGWSFMEYGMFKQFLPFLETKFVLIWCQD